ncbi:NAD dependent epimerase/dehydratase family protein, partial [Cooperia oncophora]
IQSLTPSAAKGRYSRIAWGFTCTLSVAGSDGVTLRHFPIDINDEGALEQALQGCKVVVHCAHAPLPWTYSDKKTSEALWKDNLSATEVLIDTMLRMGVKNLVHVGDAYSALPIEDNYGLGEMVFNGYPVDYILGEYGESRTRAEMYARKAIENGSSLKGVFLRPVHVHGEETSSSWRTLMEIAENGNLPYIEGERRGMHQFIYAGNLAAIVDRCLVLLSTNPQRVNSEIIYCLDDTYAIPIRQFVEQRVQSPRFSAKNEVSFEKSFLQHYLSHIKYSIGLEVPRKTLSYPMFRFLFGKTIGFSDRKQRLLLDHLPEVSSTEAMKRSLCMQKESSSVQRQSVRSG